jgi:hypothetical protein
LTVLKGQKIKQLPVPGQPAGIHQLPVQAGQENNQKMLKAVSLLLSFAVVLGCEDVFSAESAGELK